MKWAQFCSSWDILWHCPSLRLESVMCLQYSPFCKFPSHSGHHRALSGVPWAISQFSLVICFIHSSVYTSIPVSQVIPLSPYLLCYPYICSLCLSHTHIVPFKHFPQHYKVDNIITPSETRCLKKHNKCIISLQLRDCGIRTWTRVHWFEISSASQLWVVQRVSPQPCLH